MKSFNTTVVCVPELHYMVDTSEKIQQIEKLIAQGDYFTINRARQYGKTTMMYSLCRNLKAEYLVLNLSFEGWGDKAFSDDETFVNQFLSSKYIYFLSYINRSIFVTILSRYTIYGQHLFIYYATIISTIYILIL